MANQNQPGQNQGGKHEQNATKQPGGDTRQDQQDQANRKTGQQNEGGSRTDQQGNADQRHDQQGTKSDSSRRDQDQRR